MKLLLDNNLSPRLVTSLAAFHSGTAHVREFQMQRADDSTIWTFAKERGFTILSKDEDLRQRSLVSGHPPKVIWLRVGNRSTGEILEILRRSTESLSAFEQNEAASFLALS